MDRQNAQFIADGITAAHHFTQNSVSQPSRPPLFWTPASSRLLSQPAAFQIYDIRERSAQDKVIDAVKAAIASSKVKAVDIRFLDHENWVIRRYPWGGSSGERGPETQLRRVLVTSGSIHDDDQRERPITYPSP
jgi:hypothetical protein